jgi:predicted nuclease of restriction endonuclease-like (RecB) superfamily
MKMCSNEKWDVRTLQGRIDSMLYERTAISRKPEQTIINDLDLLEKENKMSQGSIRVAQYLTELPPREVFKKKLHEAINRAKSRLNNKVKMRRPIYGATGMLSNK